MDSRRLTLTLPQKQPRLVEGRESCRIFHRLSLKSTKYRWSSVGPEKIDFMPVDGIRYICGPAEIERVQNAEKRRWSVGERTWNRGCPLDTCRFEALATSMRFATRKSPWSRRSVAIIYFQRKDHDAVIACLRCDIGTNIDEKIVDK
jgi:hypothetical protein